MVNRARTGHPLIIAARQRVAMLEGERLEAGLRPNPTLTVSGENFPLERPVEGFSFGRTLDWFVTYSQTFETAGKRGLRLASAEREVEIAMAEAEEIEKRVVYEVKAAYERAAISRARVAVLEASLEQLSRLIILQGERVKAGYTAEGELIKTRLEAQRFELALRRAALDYEKARIKLLQAAGASSFTLKDTAFDVVERRDYEAVSLDPARLEEAALRQPAVKRSEARVERARSLLQLERARAKPDLTVTAGYKRNGLDNALYGAVSIPLPLYSKNRGGIARAEAEVKEAEAELRHVRSSVLAELAAARRAVEAYQHQVETLRANFLRDADETERISMIAYREGAVDLLALLDAQRSRGAAEELWLEVLADYRLAIHELERVAGIEQLPVKTPGAQSERRSDGDD